MILSFSNSLRGTRGAALGQNVLAATVDEYSVKSGGNLASFVFSAEINFHVVR